MATAIRMEQLISPVEDATRPQGASTARPSVYVVFTSVDWTLKALEKARELASPVGAGVVVVAVRVVPFPLPLDQPPVPMEFVIRRFEEKANEFPDQIKVAAYLCRDPLEALKHILNRHSSVVIGTRNKWWPSRDKRLAGKLRRAGFNIILVQSE
jgi:hypothetical protein